MYQCTMTFSDPSRPIRASTPVSIYQLLGGFVFICIYYLVFYDQSDDIVEYILGILAEFATKINVVSTQKMIYRSWSIPFL